MRKHTYRAPGKALLAIALFGILFAACNDDDSPTPPPKRSKEYAFTVSNGTGGGKVIAKELTDSTFDLVMRIDKSTRDTTYKFALYKGKTADGTLELFQEIGSIKSQTTGAAVEAKWASVKEVTVDGGKKKFNYDSLLKYQAFARVSFVDQTVTPARDSVVAIGNIGASAQ
ncbi:hypothetical protein ACFOTA_01140 [Chitinophaga sp. GCM10012297]|uniref:Uncharacterized protein n=1 Tax=Chitinophaga chungangae TaxID=2821488 RepID=A0ABS3Y7Z3_9BACT|nr:hypothetical protein [Chitinophaga chungangae]MBO9150797.1 hypothetical protein [Chitinophaga chungangae]